ncbi:16S rRNA (cytidine(1402)-2'-O)-methyltransferase [Qipengyuania sp. XHP0207]|uniref:16S rRNA (cytidine(1402)-2'-O)-methyltransferase n=1 Tax=Qipengyuania sp. XHP0207 TaxID=3038078 RepID=UPI00241DB2DA|nr:16S rRNA (cytidine(1402)-2'-O)-methyltransferase [Qipengyuania sp. XHP0207]MDG5749371.1 16S rRNA (cytidine(1402)-2'-O)-methyltransferase [Qipengyuania sp. XHP0207]
MSETPPPEKSLDPGLYIVATPIGNLGDITLRAIEVLKACDGVACEDTRITGKLLKHLGISKPLWRYDDHSEHRDRRRLVDSMQTRAVALVSDAGTPLVSDPGFRLVNDCHSEGIQVTAIPGPCAAIMGLTLSGLPNDRFMFAGFLPNKDKARREYLEGLASIDSTLVFYETAPRLLKSLDAIATSLPNREVTVARELTKLHEDVRRGLPHGLMAWYEANPPKGEIVLLVGPPVRVETTDADADALLLEALETLKPSQAAAQVAKRTGLDRKALYTRALGLRSE